MEKPRQSRNKTDTLKDKLAHLQSRKVALIGAAIVLVILLAAAIAYSFSNNVKSPAVGEYQDTSTPATASFEMDVNYVPNCEGKDGCDPNKQVFEDIKLFVFDKTGRQVRVVRADTDGVYKASLPEGEYVLLVAKTFEGTEGLPQETVTLENGKTFKLQVDYGKEINS